MLLRFNLMANDTEGQEIQRDFIIQKANILSFQGLTGAFAIRKGVFVRCDRILQKGPFNEML